MGVGGTTPNIVGGFEVEDVEEAPGRGELVREEERPLGAGDLAARVEARREALRGVSSSSFRRVEEEGLDELVAPLDAK